MGSRKSESTEVLLGSSSMKGSTTPHVQGHKERLCWSGVWTGGVLRTQLAGIAILAWLIVVVYGCNFPVKTPLLGGDFEPFWSFWVIALYALSLSIGLSVHFYPTPLGVVLAGILQGFTLVFSLYFSIIAFTAIEIHGRLDKNETTRLWGGLLYGSIVGANGGILITSLLLILSGVRDAASSTCKYNLTLRQERVRTVQKVRLTAQAPSYFV